MSEQNIRLYICFEARCGSGFLLNKLNYQKGVHVEDEWMMFNRRKGVGSHSQASHVEKFFASQANSKDGCVRGFICKVSDITDPTAFLAAIRNADVKILDLRRRNICKQALSNIRAVDAREKTGKAHAYSKSEVFGASRVDPVRFWGAVRGFEQRLEGQDRFVRQANLPTIQVYYEDLVADSSVFNALLSFLEVDPSSAVQPRDRTLKQTANRFADAVENFHEIAETAPSPYHKRLLEY